MTELGNFISPGGGGPSGAEVGTIYQLPNKKLEVKISQSQRFSTHKQELDWLKRQVLSSPTYVESNLAMDARILQNELNVDVIFVYHGHEGWRMV